MSKGISLPMGIITSSYSTCEDSAVSVALKYSLMIILEIECKFLYNTNEYSTCNYKISFYNP